MFNTQHIMSYKIASTIGDINYDLLYSLSLLVNFKKSHKYQGKDKARQL